MKQQTTNWSHSGVHIHTNSFMNTLFNESATIEEHQQKPALEKTSEPPDALGLHQSSPEADADELGSVISNRPLMTIGLLAGWLTVALMAGGCSKSPVKDPRLQSPRVEVFK